MLRKILASVAAAAVFITTFSPVEASAQRHGYYDRDHRDYRGRDRRHHQRDRDNGDAVAAGVVGLIVGLAIGSMASEPSQPRVDCRDNYQRCPPPRYYDDRRESSYDPRYDDRRASNDDYDADSAYAREYGLEGGQGSYDDYDAPPAREQCTRRERQWDRYANRYVTVDVPC